MGKEIKIFDRKNPRNYCIVNISNYTTSQLAELLTIQMDLYGRDEVEFETDGGK